MASVPSKTPVSILQELLSRRGITPKYELVQIEGAIHEPIFRYRYVLNYFGILSFLIHCESDILFGLKTLFLRY